MTPSSGANVTDWQQLVHRLEFEAAVMLAGGESEPVVRRYIRQCIPAAEKVTCLPQAVAYRFGSRLHQRLSMRWTSLGKASRQLLLPFFAEHQTLYYLATAH
jgi:hypothetical protein